MKIEQYKKEVLKLSKSYSFKETYVGLAVVYKDEVVLQIEDGSPFEFATNIRSNMFNSLPFSHKLYMLSAELAMTPPDQRKTVLYAVRAKEKDGESSLWVGHINLENLFEPEYVFQSKDLPKDNNSTIYRMPLELAKKHLTAYRELVKVEDVENKDVDQDKDVDTCDCCDDDDCDCETDDE